ncbi:MAG: ORF6N domain-containing protein [Bdellovibrionales bacterium]|nr:ORF6N domain-containing protein [Bdellovibrionales bacterium]
MLDHSLAKVYQVTTKSLVQAVTRNSKRALKIACFSLVAKNMTI